MEDKGRVKDAMKQGQVGCYELASHFLKHVIHQAFLKQITMVSTWTFEEFKAAVVKDIGSPSIPELNLKVTILKFHFFFFPIFPFAELN